MKNLAKRMVAISAALILLCVTAVAQNEKSTKSVTNDSEYGVVVAPSYVLLRPGEEAYVTVVLNPGYKNPVLIYEGESFNISDRYIFGDSFMAELLLTDGGGVIHITAYYDVYEIDAEMIYVNAMIDYGDYGLNRRTANYGVPIIIVVDPDFNNKKN